MLRILNLSNIRRIVSKVTGATRYNPTDLELAAAVEAATVAAMLGVPHDCLDVDSETLSRMTRTALDTGCLPAALLAPHEVELATQALYIAIQTQVLAGNSTTDLSELYAKLTNRPRLMSAIYLGGRNAQG